MSNVVVLDLECAKSPDDCRHCGKPQYTHAVIGSDRYEPLGWTNKPALGLSIGGYYAYADNRVHWFDEHTLETVVTDLAVLQPLMVSFNGIAFDFPLMRGILRRRIDDLDDADEMERLKADQLSELCDAFKDLSFRSYDILAEIWRADPASKFKKGLNSLDAIAQANGLGAKTGHGAQAPRDWQAGRHADVLNYCSQDIYLTKALFELITRNQGYLLRGDGKDVAIRWITPQGDPAGPSEPPFQ